MKINRIFIAILLVVAISGVAIWLKTNPDRSNAINTDNITQSEGLTTVKLSSLQNGDYTPKNIKVKLGTKVKIEADANTLTGPMGRLIIDGYDLSKDITPDSNVLEFVADKSGQFRMHCANNMGNGILTVE